MITTNDGTVHVGTAWGYDCSEQPGCVTYDGRLSKEWYNKTRHAGPARGTGRAIGRAD